MIKFHKINKMYLFYIFSKNAFLKNTLKPKNKMIYYANDLGMFRTKSHSLIINLIIQFVNIFKKPRRKIK